MYEEKKPKKSFNWKGVLLKTALVVILLILIINLLPLESRKETINGLSESFRSNMSAFRDAGHSYFKDNRLPQKVDQKSKINLGHLIEEGKVRDLKTEDDEYCDIEESYIEVIKTANDFEMEINLVCGEEDLRENIYLGISDKDKTTKPTTTKPAATTTTRRRPTEASRPTRPSTSRPSSNRPNTSKSSSSRPTTTRTFAVIFNTVGGTVIKEQYVRAGSTPFTPPNPTRPGFTFVGWFFDGTPYNFNTPIHRNKIIVARWTPNN